MLWPKKIHTRNLIPKKKSCGLKIPHPSPHNFSNGPSLSGSSCILAGGGRSGSFCSSWRDENLENPACVTESEGRILLDPSSSLACRISLFR